MSDIETQESQARHRLAIYSEALNSKSIYGLRLGWRVYNRLRDGGIITLGQLLSRSPVELNAIRGCGPTALMEVRLALGEHGLSLRDDPQAEYFIAESKSLGPNFGRPSWNASNSRRSKQAE